MRPRRREGGYLRSHPGGERRRPPRRHRKEAGPMMHGPIYTFLYWVVRFGLSLYHPIFKVVGRKRVPKTGRVLFCCNHSGLADPVWLVMALYKDHMPRIMAKKEAMAVPVLGWFLRTIGVFGIDRDGVDISGIKTGIKCLRDE